MQKNCWFSKYKEVSTLKFSNAAAVPHTERSEFLVSFGLQDKLLIKKTFQAELLLCIIQGTDQLKLINNMLTVNF